MPASAQEQYMLELVNEARLNPMANAARYITSYSPLVSNDANIQAALNFFNVSGSALLAAYQALVPVQPVARNENLGTAAQTHSQLMIAQDTQSHQLPGELDLGQRVTNAGYTGWTALSENIYAFSESVLYGHAGFMVDWGPGPGGMQSPAGHRQNIMSASYREVGIDVSPENVAATSVGPLVITQDFGRTSTSGVIILGVVYTDTDANNFYSVGEGRGSVTVWSTLAGATASTPAAGGYSLSATAGAQTLNFSGGGLPQQVSVSLAPVSGANVKVDLVGASTVLTSTSLTEISGVTVIRGLGLTGLTLIGDGNGDSIFGTNATTGDQLSGGGGADILVGGLGADTLTGGASADVFQFELVDLQTGNIDRITDYAPGTDAIRILSSITGNTVATVADSAVVTFGNGYQMTLTGSAGQVIRLDFTNRWEYWDTGTNAAWSRYTDYLNAQGAISDQEIVNDNGTLTQRHVDLSPGGTLHAWIEYTDFYSAAPHTLTDQEIRYDNGNIGQRHIGQAGTLEYTDYVTPGGVLLDQEVINLNGTREQRHYDPSNTRSAQWTSYIDYFNAANPAQITAKSMIYDPGAFTHGTFGAVHQTQWEYAVAGDTSHGVARYYNAANVLLGQELF